MEHPTEYLPVFLGRQFVGVAPKYIHPNEVKNNIYLDYDPAEDDLNDLLNIDNYDVKWGNHKFVFESRMYPFEGDPCKLTMPGDVIEMNVWFLIPKEK